MSEFAFEVRDIVYRYRNVTALNRLSVEIPFGQRVALLGAIGRG
ncbi:MAG: hypothetical protein WKF37_12160 [Bryobacteraceae bacterium]